MHLPVTCITFSILSTSQNYLSNHKLNDRQIDFNIEDMSIIIIFLIKEFQITQYLIVRNM